nr:hypothetical protein [Tanacetum cinerariifolium]
MGVYKSYFWFGKFGPSVHIIELHGRSLRTNEVKGFNGTIDDINLNVNAPAEQALARPPTRNDDQILLAADGDTARYIYQLDEQWFNLTKDTLRDALQITPVNNNNLFSSPLTPDALINFVNNMGYPKVILWGIVNRAYIDSAERMWEEFTQSIHSFVKDKKNLALHTQGKKKANLIVIPSIRYLKFSAKGTKQEVFRMPISNELITADIRGKQYYKEYLEKVAKHQRYLAGEERSDPDSPAPKPAKATKKSKTLAPKASPVTKPAAAKVSESTSSQQPKPKPAPAKTQEKKRKLVTETSDEPSPAKRSKPGLVTKRRKPTSSLRFIDEFVDEGIPEREPRFDDEEADMQMAVEESLKSVHDAHRGPLSPVVFKEPDSGKFQPLPERRTPVPTEPSCHVESPSIYVELGLTDSDMEFDEEVSPVVKIGAQDEGQAGLNPSVQIEGQAGSNPGDDAEPQPQSSPVVHAGPNLEHMDLEATDENLKLTVEEHVILEEPASYTQTLSSLQHLDKDFSFGDQFFNDKPSEAENKKTIAETEAELMVSITIHQDTSAIPPMTSPVIDLISKPDSPDDHQSNCNCNSNSNNNNDNNNTSSTTSTITRHHRLHLDKVHQDLPEAYMKEILHQRMWKTNSYKAHEDHMMLYDPYICNPPPPPPPAGPSGTSGSPGASGSSQLPPPPPPSSTSQSDQSKSTAAPSSSKIAASAEYTAWTTTNTRLRSSVSSIPKDLHMDDDTDPDEQVHSSNNEDIRNSHIPKASALASTYTPLPENSLLAQTSDMAIFMDWFCKKQGITKLKPQDLEGAAFDLVKVFHPNVIHLQYQMEECHKLLTDSVDESIIMYNVNKPLQLGGPPGQVTIQSDFFFNKDLEYLRYGSKGGRPTSGLKRNTSMTLLLWMAFLTGGSKDNDSTLTETHLRVIAELFGLILRILSVVRIEVFSMYGYDYMKKTVLRRADLNEHIITERDFKYLYPSDFEDLYLLNLQGHMNHLPPKDKKILTTATQLNLTKPRWDATGFEYKHDFTVINSPRAVTFRDKYGVQMIRRFNEIHKFSDDTLHQIDKALDYRVKEFKVNKMNPGLNTRLWIRKDVDRSKEFMFAIQKRLKTKRIFRNLESFVGGRLRDGDYKLLQRTG